MRRLNVEPSRVVLTTRNAQDLAVLREYAEFWKIPYATNIGRDRYSVIFSSGLLASQVENGDPAIILPSPREDLARIEERYKVRHIRRDKVIKMPAFRGFSAIHTTIYEFQGSNLEPILSSGGDTILARVAGTRTHLLSVDLISEYADRLGAGLDDVPSLKFRLATKLPLSYNTIPRFVRERSFRSETGLDQIREETLGPVECLRTIFLASVVTVLEAAIPRIGFWRKEKSFAASITHDVETRVGLTSGAKHLIEIENNASVASTWDVPSERYSLSSEELAPLVENGEVCSHDTKHDGRLALLDFTGKVERLEKARKSLEKKTGKEVFGFRAPLLQHSRELLLAVSKAGYRFDSSVPSWEILSPTSLRPHGAGTVFPFSMEGLVEIPVSLPQDHQLLRVAGLSPPKAVDKLLQLSDWISGLCGACVLLVHPDYEFASAENLDEYRRLIQRFSQDPECDLMTLGEMAAWWQGRSKSTLNTRYGEVVFTPGPHTNPEDFQLQLVKGYGESGFEVEDLL